MDDADKPRAYRSRSSSLVVAFLSGAYLLMAWIVTSLARGKGMILIAAAVGVLVWGIRRLNQGRPGLFYRAWFLLLLATAAVLGMELVLTWFPGILRGRVANFVFSGYHAERDGIYRWDRYLGVTMRPSFRRRMYWNGLWWTHETDERGLRGTHLDGAEAVFLGDSLIYGHGVNGDETVPARYAARTGTRAANLGQQGSCAVQYLGYLRTRGVALHPRRVFVCYHPNDVADVPYWFGREEQERFLATPDYAPVVLDELGGLPPGPFDVWALHVALPLKVSRLVRVLLKPPRDAAMGWAMHPKSAGGRFVPGESVREGPFPPVSPGATPEQQLSWRVARHALLEMRRVTEAAGARLVLFDIGYPRAFSRAVESLAEEQGVEYSHAGRVALERALAGEDVYLVDGGHWSPRGTDVVAEELARSRFPANRAHAIMPGTPPVPRAGGAGFP